MKNATRTALCAVLAAAAMGLTGIARAETPTATNNEWKSMIERLSHSMDANKDGTVSRQEFLREMGKRFDKMDTAKKGVLDMRSIEEILAELAMRPGPGS